MRYKRKVLLRKDWAMNKRDNKKPQNPLMAEKLRSLADLPLVAFELNCGHPGREYGVQKSDLIFCERCKSSKTVKRIIAS
ncbi:MAG: hypothetical protein ACKOW9_00120 [Candidatus Paceibacterota bacterium]